MKVKKNEETVPLVKSNILYSISYNYFQNATTNTPFHIHEVLHTLNNAQYALIFIEIAHSILAATWVTYGLCVTAHTPKPISIQPI